MIIHIFSVLPCTDFNSGQSLHPVNILPHKKDLCSPGQNNVTSKYRQHCSDLYYTLHQLWGSNKVSTQCVLEKIGMIHVLFPHSVFKQEEITNKSNAAQKAQQLNMNGLEEHLCHLHCSFSALCRYYDFWVRIRTSRLLHGSRWFIKRNLIIKIMINK